MAGTKVDRNRMVHASILYDFFVICINLQCHVVTQGIT